MSAALLSNRRSVLKAGGGFALAFLIGGGAKAAVSARPQAGDAEAAAADGAPAFAPNAVIRIDVDNTIRLVMPNVEMGQGIYTTEAMLIAEELDVGLGQVTLEHAPPIDALYATPALASVTTGGSTSVRANWMTLREAGAVARHMLVAAAAERWSVPAAECIVEAGVVSHPASGQKATFGELAEAAAKQPTPEKVTLKDPKDFRLIGKPIRRVDSAAKVNGSQAFGIDVRVPGMMTAVLATCPTQGGKPKAVKDANARATPGVRDIVKLDDGFAVIGDHFWAAKSGADALEIDWDLGPNGGFSTEKLFAAMEETSRTAKALVAVAEGNVDQKGKKLEAVYRLPMLAHAPMEPLNAVVHVRADACEIWVGTQVPTRVTAMAAKVTGLPEDKIILHNQYLGGGFGRRLEVDSVEVAIKIAKQVDYPVKMVWTREHDIKHDIPRPAYLDRLTAVLGDDGMPLAFTDRVTGDSVPKRWAPAILRKDGFDADTTECAAETPYHFANTKIEWAPHYLPEALPIGWWRGVGPTHNLFTVESFIDECAHAAGADPVEYRRKLLAKSPRVVGVLDVAAKAMGWGEKLGPRVGRGVAVGSPFGSHVAAMVEVEVSEGGDIRLKKAVAAVDCGVVMNPNTVEAQMQGGLVFGWTAALYGELTYENGAVKQNNFNDYRMMRLNETPHIEIHIAKSTESPGGMGEVGTAIAAPALANAVFAATGVRVRTLPIDRALLAAKAKGV